MFTGLLADEKKRQKFAWLLVLILALALGAGTAIAWSLISAANRDRRIAVANERAALDTTRIHLGDSTRALSRLVLQQDVDVEKWLEAFNRRGDTLRTMGDALDAALEDRNASVVSLQALQFSFDSTINEQALAFEGDLPNRAGDTVRIAAFTLPGPAIEGEIVVTVPRDPNASVDLETHLNVGTFTALYAQGCDDEHTPVLAFETPDWVRVDFVQGVVEPDVCNPRGRSFAATLFKPDVGKLVWSGTAFVAGYQLGKTSATATVIVTPSGQLVGYVPPRAQRLNLQLVTVWLGGRRR